MKAKERHHLKENELAETIAAAREYLEPRKKQLTLAGFVVLLAAVALAGMFIIQQQTEAKAHALLAEAMTVLDAPVTPPVDPTSDEPPAAAMMGGAGQFASERARLEAAVPKLQTAADTHPGTRSGITARYHLAGALSSLGKHEEAVRAYDDVIGRAGNSLYGRMARLGKAEEQALAGQYDAAIAAYTELAAQTDGDLPVDAILMQLARTYAAAGKSDEAQKTLTKIVDEHPDSPYADEARQQIEASKG